MAKRCICPGGIALLFGGFFFQIFQKDWINREFLENNKLLMTASRVSAWCFCDLENYIQIKCKFFISVWKSQTSCKDGSIPLVLVTYKVTLQCHARDLPEFDRSTGFFLLEPQAVEDGEGGRSRGGICICFFKKCYALGIYICKEERRFSTLRSFDPSLGFNLSYLISKHLCGLWHTHLSSRRFSVPPSKPSWKLLFWITAAQYITPGYSSDRARSRNISDSHCSFCNAEWP